MRKYCWAPKGSDTVAVPMVHGGDKRFGTLQICLAFDAMLQQPFKGYLSMIFRGKGSPALLAEKTAYHDEVSVTFQKCAWADRLYCSNHAANEFSKFLKDNLNNESFTLFADSLDGQRTYRFCNAIHELNGEVMFGPKDMTHVWQPIDHGIGYLLKSLAGHFQYIWCEQPWKDGLKNWDRWFSMGALSAKDMRILSTHWYGEAWRELTTNSKYAHALASAFVQTGCAVTDDPMTHTGITTFKSITEHWTPEEPSNEYLADHWSKHPAFNFSGMDGNSEKGSDTGSDSGDTVDEDNSASSSSGPESATD